MQPCSNYSRQSSSVLTSLDSNTIAISLLQRMGHLVFSWLDFVVSNWSVRKLWCILSRYGTFIRWQDSLPFTFWLYVFSMCLKVNISKRSVYICNNLIFNLVSHSLENSKYSRNINHCLRQDSTHYDTCSLCKQYSNVNLCMVSNFPWSSWSGVRT